MESRAAPRECPFCRSYLGEGGVPPATDVDPRVLLVILANNPWWHPESGICKDCSGRFVEAHEQARSHYAAFARGTVPILPTPVRLLASDEFTGKGVTVAFLDSGFYAHPDLVEPRDRILRYLDEIGRAHV